jgi:2-polyprenyl-3-methyl-5-hydroxy-6-metoxy-1,4-benzoquinol methylase
MNSCYFCSSSHLRASKGQRSLIFQGKKYLFLYCSDCSGFSMHPKLDNKQIEMLYSIDYIEKNPAIAEIETPQESKFVNLYNYLNSQKNIQPRRFLDYGCGSNPETLKFTNSNDFVSYGMELVSSVREIAALNSNSEILSREEVLEKRSFFDFVFLGDVLEHLVDPVAELTELRSTISANGVIIAQGPLQGAPTFLQLVVQVFSAMTPKRTSNFPPYHVSLASVKSMKAMFKSAGLEIDLLHVYEVFWPAPTFKEFAKSPSIRNLLLYLAKKTDILFSSFLPYFGSVYFIVAKPIAAR